MEKLTSKLSKIDIDNEVPIDFKLKESKTVTLKPSTKVYAQARNAIGLIAEMVTKREFVELYEKTTGQLLGPTTIGAELVTPIYTVLESVPSIIKASKPRKPQTESSKANNYYSRKFEVTDEYKVLINLVPDIRKNSKIRDDFEDYATIPTTKTLLKIYFEGKGGSLRKLVHATGIDISDITDTEITPKLLDRIAQKIVHFVPKN